MAVTEQRPGRRREGGLLGHANTLMQPPRIEPRAADQAR